MPGVGIRSKLSMQNDRDGGRKLGFEGKDEGKGGKIVHILQIQSESGGQVW